MPFGAHMSIAGGMDRALLRGREVGCETIQIFTKNNNQWRAKPLAPAHIAAYRRTLEATGIWPVVAHDGYLINLAARDPALRRRSIEAFRVEMDRAEALGIPYLVTHPGSHGGVGEGAGLARVIDALGLLLAETEGYRLAILLETTAGQGTSLGYRFEHLAEVIAGVGGSRRLGICLDTCHVFAAGYDIRTARGWAATVRSLDGIVGLDRLKALHLNDSKRELGSRVDRHEHIGRGHLGLGAFRAVVRDRRVRRLPMILETPKGQDFARADRRNLAVLRRLAGTPVRLRRAPSGIRQRRTTAGCPPEADNRWVPARRREGEGAR